MTALVGSRLMYSFTPITRCGDVTHLLPLPFLVVILLVPAPHSSSSLCLRGKAGVTVNTLWRSLARCLVPWPVYLWVFAALW